mmetsp:Transcript_62070/g.147071  ORF Transcript_62070/g.147071 Transcript_62070/m.147071 type:complete len:225 (-) Transcript_62070:300-974(-)
MIEFAAFVRFMNALSGSSFRRIISFCKTAIPAPSSESTAVISLRVLIRASTVSGWCRHTYRHFVLRSLSHKSLANSMCVWGSRRFSPIESSFSSCSVFASRSHESSPMLLTRLNLPFCDEAFLASPVPFLALKRTLLNDSVRPTCECSALCVREFPAGSKACVRLIFPSMVREASSRYCVRAKIASTRISSDIQSSKSVDDWIRIWRYFSLSIADGVLNAFVCL